MSDRKPSPTNNDAPKSKRRKQNSSGAQRPKRPLSAYNLFFREERTRYLEERAAQNNPQTDKSPFLAMSAEISKRWMCLPLEKRQKYQNMAEEETIKYHLKVDAYKSGKPVPDELKEPTADSQVAGPVLSNSAVQQTDHSHLSNVNPTLRPWLPQQQSSMFASIPTASTNTDSNLLLQYLQQQQLESASALQASLQNAQTQSLLNLTNSQQLAGLTAFQRASLENASSQFLAPREAVLPQENTALLRLIIEQQQQQRQQLRHQLTGLGLHPDLVDLELHNRRTLLGSSTQNQLQPGQTRAVSFLPASATDLSRALSSQPNYLFGERQSSNQAAQYSAVRGNDHGGEEKDASPARNRFGSQASLSSSSRDDILLRMLLANQAQHVPSLSSSNTLLSPERQASLARQQYAMNQSSRVIAAFTQGSRLPNNDEQQQQSSPDSSTS